MMQIHLRSGFTMPQLGMGTWKPDVDEGTIHDAVFEAIRCGYRHIDCAANYGNECEIGSAIRDADVDRESLFITSKLWNDAHAAADVEKACRQSLSDLGLEYLDLYLIHWPVAEGADPRPSIEETWRAMEALVDAGLVRTIGVSNFSITKLRALCDKARLPPAVNQVELHPLWRQDELLAAASKLGVHLTAYGPLGSPDSADKFNHDGGSLQEDPRVVSIATRLLRTPAQVLIRWALQRGTSAIPKSVSPDRLRENSDVFSWSLGEHDMTTLSSFEPQHKLIDGSFFLGPDKQYQTLAQLWDEPDEEQPTPQPKAKAEHEEKGREEASVGG